MLIASTSEMEVTSNKYQQQTSSRSGGSNRSQRLGASTAAAAAVVVNYTVMVYYSTLGYNNMNTAYASLSQQLEQSVKSGDFTTYLQSFAAALGVTALTQATVTSEWTGEPTVVKLSVESPTYEPTAGPGGVDEVLLSVGGIVGISLAVCVCTLCCFCVYKVAFDREDAAALNQWTSFYDSKNTDNVTKRRNQAGVAEEEETRVDAADIYGGADFGYDFDSYGDDSNSATYNSTTLKKESHLESVQSKNEAQLGHSKGRIAQMMEEKNVKKQRAAKLLSSQTGSSSSSSSAAGSGISGVMRRGSAMLMNVIARAGAGESSGGSGSNSSNSSINSAPKNEFSDPLATIPGGAASSSSSSSSSHTSVVVNNPVHR